MKGWRTFKAKAKEKVRKFAAPVFVVLVFSAMVMGTAAAANESSTTINWTSIQNMLEGVAGLMPSVGNLVVAIVPVLLTLIIVGFITGLLDSIVGAIKDAFRFFR